jgi:hypothetical protein
MGEADGGELELDPGGGEGEFAAAQRAAGLGEMGEVAGDGLWAGREMVQLVEGAPPRELLQCSSVLVARGGGDGCFQVLLDLDIEGVLREAL